MGTPPRPPSHLRAVGRRPERPSAADAPSTAPADPERRIGDAFDRIESLLGDGEPRP